MSLDEYRHKRDFGRTPEPDGSDLRPRGPSLRRFVVQRHRATRLHYDFRLEMGGVLVSWAVPKGPTLRPLVRRMAARTEDHPVEYLDFEGVIPAAEYGAGDVIVWDTGTWEPEGLDDPSAAVQDGELKFVLHGARLRGRFVLVRTRQEHQAKEDWLLIHKRDEHADEAWDIDDAPTSILSGRTSEQVGAGRTAPEVTPPARSMADIDMSGARPEEVPAFVRPMLATPVSRPFSGRDWLFELKLDGYRIQAVVHAGALSLWTRQRKDAATYFPAFAAAPPRWIGAYDAVVDGEMVALDEDGRPSFSLLQDLAGMRGLAVARGERRARGAVARTPHDVSAENGASGGSAERAAPGGSAERAAPGGSLEDAAPRGSLVYHAFDLLHLDGWNLRGVPLEERKRLLRLVLRDHPAVRYVSHVLEHGEDFQAAVIAQGLEGSVAKRRASVYEPGVRSRAWLKVKARREQELVVVGYEPGQGSHRDLGSLLVATHEPGGWRFAGHVGSGMDTATRKLFRQLLDEHRLAEPPVQGAPRLPEARWSEPRQVIRAEFTEWTTDGLLRQAVFKGREAGRPPGQVTREEAAEPPAADAGRAPGRSPSAGNGEPAAGGPAAGEPAQSATADELAALDALGNGGRWHVGGQEVSLTNLDKVLFPKAGYTKRDLVRYYVTMAPVILPYLRARPLNVHRWPDGVEGRTQFWQKQIPGHAPEWVARWDYPEAGRDQSHTYVVADRVATMAWLANQAVIDLHPWTSRLPEYWRPTYAYIDIDPGERTTWPEVLTLARLFRTALGHLGVRGYPKVTGKRGIQVWLNVQPRYTFDDTRDWVGALSRGVGAVVPDLVSWEWGKADRGGRARLDYTQNSPIHTLVAPYAVRPVATASVSAPITWDELDDPTLSAQRWDLRSMVDRVREAGDLFAGVLDDPQELPAIS